MVHEKSSIKHAKYLLKQLKEKKSEMSKEDYSERKAELKKQLRLARASSEKTSDQLAAHAISPEGRSNWLFILIAVIVIVAFIVLAVVASRPPA
tara:strand:- start:31 stop:312 length:282 start_codon:yes stop_codon:yes gene_type:complete